MPGRDLLRRDEEAHDDSATLLQHDEPSMFWHAKNYTDSTIESHGSCSLCVFALLNLLFFAYCIYALVGGNDQKLFDSCGNGLWQYVISRIIIGFFTGGVIFFLKWPTSSKSVFRMFACVAYGLLHIASVVVGSILTRDAMGNSGCVAAMSAASYTGTPLLAIMSIFLLILDGIYLLSCICGLCIFFTIRRMATTFDDGATVWT